MKKYFIIAGEPSGDLQASKLMRAMNKQADCKWYGIGGDLMMKEGLTILKHLNKMAFMGFLEVIKHLPEIFNNLKITNKAIIEFEPDAVILIDYPGFNLKVAKHIKKTGIKVIYYITPQLWAWHKGRVKLMKKYVDEIINIFPFEVDFYKRHGIDSHYFGHPLTEELTTKYGTRKELLDSLEIINDQDFIAILPGSRIDEVQNTIHIIKQFINDKPEQLFLIAKVKHIDQSVYGDFEKNVKSVEELSYDLMKFAKLAIVTSGTATLETACFETPLIVIYKTSLITYFIAKLLVKLPYISLVNIVAGKRIVTELIQSDLTYTNLDKSLLLTFQNEKKIREDLKDVHLKLAQQNVSKNVGNFILSTD